MESVMFIPTGYVRAGPASRACPLTQALPMIIMRHMPAKAPEPGPAVAAMLAGIGTRIRDRRKALGVSVVDVAEVAGMSRVTLHRIERGEASVTIGAYLNVITALRL